MKSKEKSISEGELHFFCQQASTIYHSKEFIQLHKEMIKMYKKKGIHNFKLIAFQDSLFSVYLEVNDGERNSQMQML